MALRPFTLSWDDAPIDLSFLYESERPAGCRGFVRAVGNRLEFEDGTEARFWGACFNSGANFPSHREAEAVADRLAKFGVNMVRTHQMDAEWATPNIFEFNRAHPRDGTRALDPNSLDRLDYLIHCLKQRGIYLYLDLLTYRRFLAGDDVDAAAALQDAAKAYFYFDERLIELQREFNAQLWSHINPYTELAYCDEPAIALTELVNESDLQTNPVVVEPYRSRLEDRFRNWLVEDGQEPPTSPVDFTTPSTSMLRFFREVQETYYRDMMAHLRSLGVQIPIAGTNWSRNAMTRQSQAPTDFMDTHWYWNFPEWEQGGTTVIPMVRERVNAFVTGTYHRRADKPVFISEWDHAWPDEWRAESPLAYAAVAAFQGWSGMTIHAYRYASYGPVERIGGGASTIDGSTYRNHFDTFNDPAKFGLFYHAAMIVRRGDVRPANEHVTVVIDERTPGRTDWLWEEHWGPRDIDTLALLPEQHGAAVAFPGEPTSGTVVSGARDTGDAETSEVVSDTGELRRDWRRGIGVIDSERTKAVYGFVGEAGSLTLRDLTIEAQTDFATIALSSLSDDPIAASRMLLLTAVGRCDNTDTRYDDARRLQLDRGRAPVLIEVIEARISLRTPHRDLKVWLVSDRGHAAFELETAYDDGTMSFEIGPQPEHSPSSMYYLIKP
jgi:hypothetical protein